MDRPFDLVATRSGSTRTQREIPQTGIRPSLIVEITVGAFI